MNTLKPTIGTSASTAMRDYSSINHYALLEAKFLRKAMPDRILTRNRRAAIALFIGLNLLTIAGMMIFFGLPN